MGCLSGLLLVAIAALILGELTGRGFWSSAAVLTGCMAVSVTTILWMMLRWARSGDERLTRFSVGSLCLVFLVLAAILGMLRWFVEGDWFVPRPSLGIRWLSMGLAFGFVLGPIGLIASLRMADGALWLGVWLLKVARRRGWFTRKNQSAAQAPGDSSGWPPP